MRRRASHTIPSRIKGLHAGVHRTKLKAHDQFSTSEKTIEPNSTGTSQAKAGVFGTQTVD